MLHYSNGHTYFFSGRQYWRFNDRAFSVDRAEPPFPRSTAAWWLGCTAPALKQGESVCRHAYC